MPLKHRTRRSVLALTFLSTYLRMYLPINIYIQTGSLEHATMGFSDKKIYCENAGIYH